MAILKKNIPDNILHHNTAPGGAPALPISFAGRWEHYAWIPLPVFIIAIGVITFARIPVVYNPPTLLPILDILFLSIILFFVSFLAAHSYLSRHSSVILFLGSGALAFGLSAALAGFSSFRSAQNPAITIFNVGAFLAAAFHLLSAIESFVGSEDKTHSYRWPFLAAMYGATIAITVLFLWRPSDICSRHSISKCRRRR
jgi:hypothetical protein